MSHYAIFAKNGKIVAIEESELGCFCPIGATFLKVVQAKRMNSRILKRLMETTEK